MTENRSEGPAEEGSPGGGLPSVTVAYVAGSAVASLPAVAKALDELSGAPDGTGTLAEDLFGGEGHREPPQGSRSDVVEGLLRELEHLWAVEILRGVESVAREQGTGMVVSEFGPGGAKAVVGDGPAGPGSQSILWVALLREAERDRLRAMGIPFVVFDPMDEQPEDVPFVSATNWKGARAAVQHLVDLGHRRIAMISGPGHPFCVARVAGYSSALHEAGIAADPDLLVRTWLTRDHGYAAARELLSRPDRPTALFTASDVQSIGVYQAAQELGLSIPADLSVASFDDLPVAAWMDPPLTTVRQPLTAMAMAASELALALGRGDEMVQTRADVATTFVIRESTAAPGH